VTRKNLIIAIAAPVALIAAFWMLVLAPKRQEATKLGAKVSAKQSELTTAQSTLAGYRKARDAYAGNYATVVRLGKAVPQDDDTRSLLVQLDAAAAHSGIDFRRMAIAQSAGASSAAAAAATTTAGTQAPPPGAIVGTAGFNVLPLTFSFRGNFFNMSQFFSRLEKFVKVDNKQIDVTGRLLRIDSITLKPDTLGFPSLRADITASAYQIPADQGLTAGATASGPATTPASTTKPGGTATPATTTATVSGVTR
jgi:Tfp pilus assembly protein PilO